ncbi:APO protein 1, chloroplastic-like isoform X2 [Pyrus communis]|uniref:APO protein 1, chloroplastic-like isoform X2 n=1 Tax=Pyrus communis TaxID=23211 RepID=UPI0035C04C46
MFQNPPTVSSALREPYPKGACLCTVEFKLPQLSAARSYSLGLKFEHGKLHKGGSIFGTFFAASRKTRVEPTSRKQEAYPQNVDLPPVLPKNKKKPYPIPLKKIK